MAETLLGVEGNAWIGGLLDIVEHESTWYLTEAFDSEDLANGILWVFDDPVIARPRRRRGHPPTTSRAQAVVNYSSEVVAAQLKKSTSQSWMLRDAIGLRKPDSSRKISS